jgi:hypothetical protein
MADVKVGPRSKELAIKLLAAADVLEVGPAAVKTVGGGYMVPQEVADEAKVEYGPYSEDVPAEEEPKATAKAQTTTEKKPAAKPKAATKKE